MADDTQGAGEQQGADQQQQDTNQQDNSADQQQQGAGDSNAGGEGGWLDSASENWRNDIAASMGGEQKDIDARVAQLERIGSPKDFAKSFFHAQDTIRSGAHKERPGADSSEEHWAEYRRANDIPADSRDYKIDLGEDAQPEQKEIVDQWLKVAHEYNLTQDQAAGIAKAEIDIVAAQQEALEARDQEGYANSQTEMTERWGADTQRNVNLIAGMVNLMPEEHRDTIMQARGPDGVPIMHNPEVLEWFADLARQVNPTGAVVPNSTNPIQSVSAELDKLHGEMRKDYDAWQDPGNVSKRQRYDDLLEAHERATGKEYNPGVSGA